MRYLVETCCQSSLTYGIFPWQRQHGEESRLVSRWLDKVNLAGLRRTAHAKTDAESQRHQSRNLLHFSAKLKKSTEYNAALPEELINATTLSVRLSVAANTGNLDISDCGLDEVPSAVWDLTDLEDLSLAGNRIRDLPPAIANLRKLRRLGLAGNRLRFLPPEIGQLQALEGLWLHGNLLQHLPNEIGALTNLRMLALAGNQLKTLPESISQLSNLQVLSAAGNELQEVPSGLSGLVKLKVLALYGNRLRQLPAQLSSLEALQDLWLQGNRLETLPPDLAGMTSLRQLSLADNVLTTLPDSIASLPSLQTIWLYGNQLTSLPAALGLSPSLSNLWLESNPLDGEQLGQLVPSLQHLKAVGIDTEQAARLPRDIPLSGNFSVGRIAGTGAAARCGGYFKIQPWAPCSRIQEEASRAPVLVVAFGSAPGVPNWGGLLRKVRQAMGIGGKGAVFDVLYVVDPARSWYTHGPLAALQGRAGQEAAEGATADVAAHARSGGWDYSNLDISSRIGERQSGTWDSFPRENNGAPSSEQMGEYYWREVKAAVRGYSRVVLLGDSMGGSAALRFAPLATAALAFCPQVDLSTASIRPGRGQKWHVAFRDSLLSAVDRSEASVSVHCGNWSHDVDQARLLGSSKVKLQVHQVEDHRLAKELDTRGELASVVIMLLTEELSKSGA